MAVAVLEGGTPGVDRRPDVESAKCLFTRGRIQNGENTGIPCPRSNIARVSECTESPTTGEP